MCSYFLLNLLELRFLLIIVNQVLQNKEGAKLSKKELELWATTTWAIWNARNKAYFEKVQIQPKVILDVALALLVTYQMLSATQANMIMVQMGLRCFVGLEGSLVCFFFIICMANKLAWAVCPGLYLCTWFFTSKKKSFYLVSQKKKKKKGVTKQMCLLT